MFKADFVEVINEFLPFRYYLFFVKGMELMNWCRWSKILNSLQTDGQTNEVQQKIRRTHSRYQLKKFSVNVIAYALYIFT